MAASAQKMAPGTIVADKYRLERVLGRGGMGMVIEAKHVQLGTSFALKFLHRSFMDTESVPERFLREARATAGLRSEHVCRVFDYGSFEGRPYLVMELLEGTDLEKVLRREKRLSPQLACSYLIQACAGVSDAHAAQIVHRDLKPGNLFLMTRGDGSSIVKVLDFGIAKAPHETELGLTGTNAVLGSPAYMSLEQLRSSRLVDARSDIWSLGVILYELVAGQRPFTGDGVADLALRIAMEVGTPPLPKEIGPPRVRAALDEIIGRCLERDPAKRYQSVAELALALAPFADEHERRIASSLGRSSTKPSEAAEPPEGGPVGPELEMTAIGAATTMQSHGAIENPATARARRSTGRTVGIVLAAALVVGAALAVVTVVTMGGDAASPEAGAMIHAGPAASAAAVPPVAGATAASAAVVPPVAGATAAPAAVVPPVAGATAAPGAAAEPGAPPAPTAAPQPQPPLLSQPPGAAPTITLRFVIEPAGAAVELDGVFVTSRQITVRKDDVLHRLRISAPGYIAQQREVRLDDSQRLVIQLRRQAAPAAKPQRRLESRSPYE